MVRSIPEKTFEHWASMYVAHRFPLGGLWWPTLGEDIHVEDLGTVPGKSVLLEAKVPEQHPDGTHSVTIDVSQLIKYLASPVPVYYIFPTPPWNGILSTSSWLGVERRADLAYRRAGHRWFGQWTQVCAAPDLYSHLSPGPNRTSTIKGLPARHWAWADFWKEFQACGSAALSSAFIVDSPNPDTTTRDSLRARLGGLRESLSREQRGRRDHFVNLLRGSRSSVYVPDRSSADAELYRLADDDELSRGLSSLLETDGPPAVGQVVQNLSVCHVPFTVLS